jgi:hypothetical protein
MTFEVQRPWHCLHSNHLVLTDTPTPLSQPHTKVDPYTYRPKRSSQSSSHRYADPALPAPYKGRPLYVPPKTIFTILLSQFSLSPCKSRPPTFTDQNQKPFHSNHLFSQIPEACSPRALVKAEPHVTDRNHLVLTDSLNSSPSAHVKADPKTYRPKPSKQSCSPRYTGL